MKKILNIGCGFRKMEGAINLDIDCRCKPDILHDITKLLPFESNMFDEVYADHVFEHLLHFEELLIDIHRVLKLNGILYASVPLWPSGVSIAGVGHVRQFLPESFMMFCNPRWYQPKMHPSDYHGLFELEQAIVQKGTTGDEEGKWISNLKVELKKVDKEYWLKQGVHRDLNNDIYGCFWCGHELVYTSETGTHVQKRCPNCKEWFEIKREAIC